MAYTQLRGPEPHLARARRGVAFQSMQEQLDTITSGGKPILPRFASLAEFEPGTRRSGW